jgi:hypothetical protein
MPTPLTPLLLLQLLLSCLRLLQQQRIIHLRQHVPHMGHAHYIIPHDHINLCIAPSFGCDPRLKLSPQ